MPIPLATLAVPAAAGALGFGGGFLAADGFRALKHVIIISALGYGAVMLARSG